MTCPDAPVIALLASLGDEAPPANDDLLDGWTPEALRSHVASCTGCSESVAQWRASVERWKTVDLIDTTSYSDHYFEQLARETEESLDRSDLPELTTPPLDLEQARRARRNTVAVLVGIAATVLVGLGLLKITATTPTAPVETAQNQSPDETNVPDDRIADPQAIETAQAQTPSDLETSTDPTEEDGAIEAQGRQLGRELIASLMARDVSDGGNGSRGGLDNEALDDDLDYFFSTSVEDQLDSLEGDEIQLIISRL